MGCAWGKAMAWRLTIGLGIFLMVGCHLDFSHTPLPSCSGDCGAPDLRDLNGGDTSPADTSAADIEVAEACGGLCAASACCEPEAGIDGCVDLISNNAHCGACGVSCGPSQTCVGASCQCLAGLGDCDRFPENGCETPLNKPVHCGACGTTCGPGESCVDGACVCGEQVSPAGRVCKEGLTCCNGICQESCVCGLGTCSAPETCCGDDLCTRLNTAQNCGGCGVTCEGAGQCFFGICVCAEEGYVYCPGSGCVTLGLDTSCGRTCERSTDCTRPELHFAQTGVCESGACAGTCAEFFLDCDGDTHTGCETEGNTGENCGTCGYSCVGDPGTELHGTFLGCEIIPDLDDPWPPAERGNCIFECETGWADCDPDVPGCETDITGDPNCGACGVDCAGTPGWADGVQCTESLATGDYACVGACALGFDDCDSDPANGCEDLNSNKAHCGFCGNACPGLQVCSPSGCTCEGPLVMCNDTCVRLGTRSHCSSCGDTCGLNETCTDGACRLAN